MKNDNFFKKLVVCLAFLCNASFSQSSFTDNRDGKKYKAVKIGEQVWMAENLNYEAEGSRCYGENGLVYKTVGKDGVNLSLPEIQANCTKYGKLYDWATAMNIDTAYNNSGDIGLIFGNAKDKNNARKPILWGGSDVKHRGICPGDWHLPSSEEWLVLAKSVGDSIAQSGGGDVVGKSLTIANKSFDAGTKLKAKSGWSNNGNGTDDYGFSALPGGYGIQTLGNFYNVGDTGYWWTATENNASVARSRSVMYDYVDLNRRTNRKADLLSVRCVQD